MASRTRAKTMPAGMTLGPAEGGNAILAAWQGLRNLFGAKAERFEVTSEGVTVVGLDNLSANIVENITKRGENIFSPRLDLVELFPIVNGQEPAPFVSPAELTEWQTRFVARTNEGRSPQWSKDAIAEYKAANGFAAARGRPRKNIVKVDLDNITIPDDISAEDATKFKEFLANMSAAPTVE